MKLKRPRALRVQLYRLDDPDNKRAFHCMLPDNDAKWQQYIQQAKDTPIFDEEGKLDSWLHGLITSITHSEYTLEDDRVNRTLEEYERVRRGKFSPWSPSPHNIKRMQILKRILMSFILRAARDRRHSYHIAFSFVGERRNIPDPEELNKTLDVEGSD